MTEMEFREESRNWNWGDYAYFCREEGLDEYAEGIMSDDERDDWITESLDDLIRGSHSWKDVLRDLEDYDSYSSCWWRLDDWGGWVPLDNDCLQDAIDELYNIMEFEDEENEEEYEEAEIDINELLFG